jgi:hypothetical protein
MNYYQARKRESDGRWDYTRNNRPAGYCQEFKEFDPEFVENYHISEVEVEKHNKFSDKYHTDGHECEEEACDCYKEYQLDHALRLGLKMSDQQMKCKICDEWTQKYAEIDCSMYILCDEHNNREEVEKLYKAPEFSMSSW